METTVKPTRRPPHRACKRTHGLNSEQPRTLDQLPDDVLLLVMQHLAVQDLLACRLVCRRLGELALQPEVWRRRSLIPSPYKNDRLTCPVSRLAPCLRHLTVLPPSRKGVCGHLHTTTCAVEGLEVRGSWDRTQRFVTFQDGAFAARLIQHQASLGRLRRVRVVLEIVDKPYMSEDNVCILFRTLISTPGLEELDLFVSTGSTGPLPLVLGTCSQVVSSSIRRFHAAVETDESFSQLVLRTHAATLEEVHFVGSKEGDLLSLSTATLQLLVGLPCLREVALDDQRGMEVLAQCATLRTLTITMMGSGYPDAAAAAAAAELLRRACQVREVNIRGYLYHFDCFRALASSERSNLEKLHIACPIWSSREKELLQVLLQALPQLPALRDLHVGQLSRQACEEILLAVSPATQPALRLVSVHGSGCRLARKDAVRALLTAQPELHVRVAMEWGPDKHRSPFQQMLPDKVAIPPVRAATLVLEGCSPSPKYHNPLDTVVHVEELVR
ncbi:uncharacterized protein LOC113215189 isoform X2 [Frankliniella occidentalis]|nr:uncharacterized protein LOC113215189 isoform X2 [Frankliniella occidentalis]